jgi:hypothetical protein
LRGSLLIIEGCFSLEKKEELGAMDLALAYIETIYKDECNKGLSSNLEVWVNKSRQEK